MIGVVGGSVTALLWGTSAVAASTTSRALGPRSAAAWVYLVGLTVSLPVAIAGGLPDADGGAAGWTALVVSMAVVSLYFMYAALGRGPVSLVMPVTAAQGAVAAILAVAGGEELSTAAALGLAAVLGGMFAVMRTPRAGHAAGRHGAAVAFAALSAATAGIALFSTAPAGDAIGVAWVVVAVRVTGVLGLGLPLAVTGRLVDPRPVLPRIVFSGLADASALACFVLAATRDGVAVPAVIASQFAAVSAVIAMVAYKERLTRLQLSGVVAILCGVAVVIAAQA